MQGAVLADEDAAIDGHDVVLGEGSLQLAAGEVVVLRLTVGGKEDGVVDNEEVGVGGGQAVTIVGVEDGRWQGEREQLKIENWKLRNELLKLLFHRLEGFVVLVVGIGAADVCYGVVGTEAGEGVDVAIGVVAGKVAVIEPEDALGVEIAKQALFNLVASELWIAIGRKQTFAGSQEGATAVALNAAAFEDEVEVRFVGTMQRQGSESPVYLVVEVGGELVAPAVEAEIEQTGTCLGEEGEEGVVARPSVVGGTLEVADLGQQVRGNSLAQESFDAVGFWGDDEEELVANEDLEGYADKAIVNLTQEWCPVGSGMGPRELHAALRVPLGGEECRANLGLLWACQTGKLEV